MGKQAKRGAVFDITMLVTLIVKQKCNTIEPPGEFKF